MAEEANVQATVETVPDRDNSETKADAAPDTQASARDYAKEKEFRRAEQAFVNLDQNSNCVIDDEEWAALYEEKRGLVPKAEWEQKPDKMKILDANKDGVLSDEEIDKWIRTRFEERIKRYVKSEVFKSRKAEFEKQQSGKSE